MKSGARGSKAGFAPSSEVERVELTVAHSTISIVSLAAINFQHAILHRFVCDIGDRITYFYGAGIRNISLNVLAERSFIFPAGSLERVTSSQSKGASMNKRTYPVACYRRTTARNEAAGSFAKIGPAIMVRKFPNNPGPPGHWNYVINGAIRRRAVRSDGQRQVIDLMLPQDFAVSDIQNEVAIEAIAKSLVISQP